MLETHLHLNASFCKRCIINHKITGIVVYLNKILIKIFILCFKRYLYVSRIRLFPKTHIIDTQAIHNNIHLLQRDVLQALIRC